jgi:hypothetical protein
MEVSSQLHALADLTLAPIREEAGWVPESVWTVWRREKSLSPVRNETLVVQPVAQYYTD